MMPSFTALEAAVGYDEDEQVAAAALKLIRALDRELTAENYEEGTEVEEATADLEEAMKLSDIEHDSKEDDEDDEEEE